MDASSPSPASSAVPPPPPPPPPPEAELEDREKDMVHRTKVIQFLGRTTPIFLQNDNGPCPLLAICNVLSLKNSLNSSPDVPEVSQEKLLSLVAERLIDSNSNTDDKDAGFVENQQQNIADAIDLLPRLTTGIDVNIKFRRIDDFEFTRECAIFDLLDIPLYHGWIVDPQDSETADAIGSKSYNTVMEELVSLETQAMDSEKKDDPDDDVDFAAATTATLGVPSPCLSRGQSFDDSPQKSRKGDTEEETELSRVLKLSEADKSNSVADVNIVENSCMDKSELGGHSETVEKNVNDEIVKTETSNSDDSNALSSKIVLENNFVQCTTEESTEPRECAVDNVICDLQIENQNARPVSLGEDSQSACNAFPSTVEDRKNEFTSTPNLDEPRKNPSDCEAADLDSKSGQVHPIDRPDAFTSSGDGGEPMYEGEERIMESGTAPYENQEPIYEGEVVLALQVDDELKDRLCVKQGELIRSFMKSSASQLTIYGLFCLQDKVKERELCVFFRNNHFNTMFKYEGELYILATDQGYISQPDLVWEKLNEVNGDTLFMTGNFKEFKMDEQSNATWDEQNAIASTADYLACMDGVAPADSSFNSDMQLAIALQQQEFEQQQQQPQHNSQQPSASGGSGSRLVTGPQVSQYVPPPKQPAKPKDKCIVM